MGCDIHSFVEKRNAETGQWEKMRDLFPLSEWERDYLKKELGDSPFNDRNYGTFGFLCGVRNYSHVPALSAPRGLPEDASQAVAAEYADWGTDAHSASWLSVDELANFNYDDTFEDRRVMRNGNGAALAGIGEGKLMTFREFLGPNFLRDVGILAGVGSQDTVRVVFWFDN